jgi:phosphoadenosine phosphosulfate reductase
MRRRLSESCIPKNNFYLNPIVDWSDSDVWDFIKLRNLPMNPLYEMGYSRVGCVGCPMSARGKKELNNNPKYKGAYFRAAKKYIEHRIEAGLRTDKTYQNVEEYFSWWLKL